MCVLVCIVCIIFIHFFFFSSTFCMVHCALDPAVDYAPVKKCPLPLQTHTQDQSSMSFCYLLIIIFATFCVIHCALDLAVAHAPVKTVHYHYKHTHRTSPICHLIFIYIFFAPAATDSDDSGGRQAKELGAGGDGDQAAGRGPACLVPVHRPGPGGGASLHPGGRGGGRPQLPGPPVRPRLPHTGVLHLPVLLSHEQGGLSGGTVLLLLLVGVGRGAGGW